MSYRIFYHQGHELGLKTRVLGGRARLEVDALVIHPKEGIGIRVPFHTINAVSLMRLHGLGRVIRIDHAASTMYLSVVRLMIGQFALINFFATGALHKQLSAAAAACTKS